MANDAGRLVGVKGWLALFVVTLVLTALVALPVPLATKAYTSPLLTSHPGWGWYMALQWVLALVRAGGFTFVAWLLCERQVPATPRTAILCLWTLALGPALADLVGGTVLLGIGPAAAATVVGMQLIRPLAFAAVWTLYLRRSRRVRHTYADESEELVAVFR